MDAKLELLTGILMDEGRSVDRVVLYFRGKRDVARHLCIVPLGGLDDLACRIVDQFVIVGLDAEAQLLWCIGLCHVKYQESIANPAYVSISQRKMTLDSFNALFYRLQRGVA